MKQKSKLHPILKEANDTLHSKSQDYGELDFSRENYFPYKDLSYITMLHIKLERLKNLVENQDPNFESQIDSVLDLINYAAFYGSYLKNKNGS